MPASQKYVLDANVFIEAHRRYYSFDIAPGFWNQLLHLANNDQICSIDKVLNELTISNDELCKWAENEFHPFFLNTQTTKTLESYQTIVTWAQKQSQYKQTAKDDFMQSDNADAWLLAFAKANNFQIVTQEVYNENARKNIPIPNVCEAFQLDYLNTFDLLKELKVTL